MRRVASILVVVPLALLAVLWPAGSSGAGSSGAGPNAQGASPLAPQAGAPTVVSYQGQVTVGGLPYTGDGAFKFAVVDASGATNYWANDGTAGGAPGAAVTLPVTGGLFSVLLGEGMTALPASTINTLAGPLLGAMLLVPLSELLREFGTLRIVFYGAILIICVIGLPEGIFHYLSRKYNEMERWVKIE